MNAKEYLKKCGFPTEHVDFDLVAEFIEGFHQLMSKEEAEERYWRAVNTYKKTTGDWPGEIEREFYRIASGKEEA